METHVSEVVADNRSNCNFDTQGLKFVKAVFHPPQRRLSRGAPKAAEDGSARAGGPARPDSAASARGARRCSQRPVAVVAAASSVLAAEWRGERGAGSWCCVVVPGCCVCVRV